MYRWRGERKKNYSLFIVEAGLYMAEERKRQRGISPK